MVTVRQQHPAWMSINITLLSYSAAMFDTKKVISCHIYVCIAKFVIDAGMIIMWYGFAKHYYVRDFMVSMLLLSTDRNEQQTSSTSRLLNIKQ